jgi:hypothetical protein
VPALLTTWLIQVADQRPRAELVAPAALVGLATVVRGGLFERRSRAVPLEVARLLGFAGWLVVSTPTR